MPFILKLEIALHVLTPSPWDQMDNVVHALLLPILAGSDALVLMILTHSQLFSLPNARTTIYWSKAMVLTNAFQPKNVYQELHLNAKFVLQIIRQMV